MQLRIRRIVPAVPFAVTVAVGCLVAAQAVAGETPQAATEEKHVSGMSIVGNDEAPKSLVIVPWKSSDLGDRLDVSGITDDDRGPVDRKVLERELDYYEIRTGSRE